MQRIDIPAWALQRARNRLHEIVPERTALLVIDMQSAFVDLPPMGNPTAAEIIPNINQLSGATLATNGSRFAASRLHEFVKCPYEVAR